MINDSDEAQETGHQRMLRDSRATAALITLSLLELTDNAEMLSQIPAWAADHVHGACSSIAVLHTRGNQEVLDAALHLCDSGLPLERRLGAKLLGELGENRPFREEGCDRLLYLLANETDRSVLLEAIYALGHLTTRRADKLVAMLANHPDASIRGATAFALKGTTDPDGIRSLLALMQEPDAETRDWATTGIGEHPTIDGPDIRAALLKRTKDADTITRAEAFHGLARRKDPRVLPLLITELRRHLKPSGDRKNKHLDYKFREAACAMLDWPEGKELDAAALITALQAMESSTT
jgi:HEAT repeat protein